jgi:acyl carrier protein
MIAPRLVSTVLLLAALAGCAGAPGSTSANGPKAAPQAAVGAEPGAESRSGRVIALIVRETGAPQERVVPKARFVEDLGLDELDMVELIMVLEDEFEIVIPDEDFESLVTVADVIEYVRTHT